MRTKLTFVFIFSTCFAFTHKDRIESPKSYLFIFQNQDTIRLDNPKDPLLKTYSDDIVNGKRKLIKAELLFETGETMTFQNNGNKWTRIEISDGKKVIGTPLTTIEKISEIHFATIALLWNGNDNRALSASYFYIRFDIGTERAYDKYPELHLSFSEQQFSKSIIWRQVGKNSKQWKDF